MSLLEQLQTLSHKQCQSLPFFERVLTENSPGHFAITEIQKKKKDFHVITQNVDGLHQSAGTENVYEVHGSLMRMRCSSCGIRREIPKDQLEETVENVLRPGWLLTRLLITKSNLPRCAACQVNLLISHED